MGQPRNYVVRVYRRGFESLEGLVEDTRTGAEQPFSSIEQLWALLRGPIPRKSRYPLRHSAKRPDGVSPRNQRGNKGDPD